MFFFFGKYISQDPIGLHGGSQLYGYVHNPNGWIDQFGLSELVYQLLNDKGEVVYYGITSRTAEEQLEKARLLNKNRGRVKER